MTTRKTPQSDNPGDAPAPAPDATPQAENIAVDAALPDADLSLQHAVNPAPPPAAQSGPVKGRSGAVWPMVGGAVAMLAGFALSHFNLLGLAVPDSAKALTDVTAEVTALARSNETALEQLASLSDRLSKVEAAPAPPTTDPARLDDLERQVATLAALPSSDIASSPALVAKVAELDRRLAALSSDAPAAEVQARLDAALERLDAAETAAATRAAEAEALTAATRKSQALDALAKAVSTGNPFVAELQALSDPALVQSLGTVAKTGAPTLKKLQADYPVAAREALAIDRESRPDAGWSDRLVDFLAAQTGARSLAPREGTSVDAILSRAEFALSDGRVPDALGYVAALDPLPKAAFADWTAAANTYLQTMSALQAAGVN